RCNRERRLMGFVRRRGGTTISASLVVAVVGCLQATGHQETRKHNGRNSRHGEHGGTAFLLTVTSRGLRITRCASGHAFAGRAICIENASGADSITDSALPGIAGMDKEGRFSNSLNSVRPGQGPSLTVLIPRFEGP